MICPHCGSTPALTPKSPAPTVDIIIQINGGIVLIKRRYPPLGWALPGGFVDYGESLEQAAIREAKEETGLDVCLLKQFHTYSDPSRDLRRHTISTVFVAAASGQPAGGDDAAEARIFHQDSLPSLVFDHAQILADFFSSSTPCRHAPSPRDNL